MITSFRRALCCGILLSLAVVQGCGYLATSKRPPAPVAPISVEGFSPAGEWIYEDKIATGIADLDEKGNGTYPWKGGYFVTQGWQGGLWQGTWHQPGNDREGGFEIQLSEDFGTGHGRWWYTRIGDDKSPTKPGGTFLLTRP